MCGTSRPTQGIDSTNIYKDAHGHFLSDHEIERRSALGVIDSCKCRKPGTNDLLKYHETAQRYFFKCSHKSCPRHWKRASSRLWHRYKQQLPTTGHITHIRLTAKIRLSKRERGIERWAEKVTTAYPGCFLLLVVHRGKANDHWHAILGTEQPPDLEQLRKFWKSHRPGKKVAPWHCSHAMAKPHNNAQKLLRYLLFGRKGNKVPPWRDIVCRSPVVLKARGLNLLTSVDDIVYKQASKPPSACVGLRHKQQGEQAMSFHQTAQDEARLKDNNRVVNSLAKEIPGSTVTRIARDKDTGTAVYALNVGQWRFDLDYLNEEQDGYRLSVLKEGKYHGGQYFDTDTDLLNAVKKFTESKETETRKVSEFIAYIATPEDMAEMEFDATGDASIEDDYGQSFWKGAGYYDLSSGSYVYIGERLQDLEDHQGG